MSIYHHTLYNRAAWNSHEATRDLRGNRWMIPPLHHESERLIHSEVAVVPLLDPVTALHVRNGFEPVEGNFVESMYEFISTVERVLKHPKSSTLQRTLGALTAQAVEMQIPYVQDGLIETDPIQPVIVRTQDFQRGTW